MKNVVIENIMGKIVWVNNKLYTVVDTYEGDRDLSYHGAPRYEQFIVCEEVNTKEKKIFGSESYTWYIAENYIRNLEVYKENVKKNLKELCSKLNV